MSVQKPKQNSYAIHKEAVSQKMCGEKNNNLNIWVAE